MNRVSQFPESPAMAGAYRAPSITAQYVIKQCGRDIYANQASGPMVRVSWLDDQTAWKVWACIESVIADSGPEVSRAVRCVSINHDDTAATVFVDPFDLEEVGAEWPDSLPWMIEFNGSKYLVSCVVQECSA